MTPAARISAAIDVLDTIHSGTPAEQALTNWARGNRYAGSSDRAAIRDHVFDALRRRRSAAYLGGGETGRALMIGLLRTSAANPDTLFSGEKFAPAPLSEEERVEPDLAAAPRAVRLDCPDWLVDHFDRSLGADSDAVLEALRHRAPVFVRANLARADRAGVQAALLAEEIETAESPLSPSALEVTSRPRRVALSAPYRDGLVELQDAASQAVVDLLPLTDGDKVLDYCAGGGRKTLAMAARARVSVSAHDALPERMKDLPQRAQRAGISVEIAETEGLAGRTFDLVLCDVPCSGSGAWRRAPAAKWALESAKLADLVRQQAKILRAGAGYVAPGGHLAYVTCSLFEEENQAQVADFLAEFPKFSLVSQTRFTPLQGGDGFFVAILKME